MPQIIENILEFITKKQFYGPILAILGGLLVHGILCIIFDKIIIPSKDSLEKKRRVTILQLFENISKYLIFIVVILIALEIYGINTQSVIAGLGIMGLVIGLSLQDTLKDLISGITIIMDNYYIVGDTIEYASFKGEVTSLGLRSTKIKKETGEVLTFANRNVDKVINFSQKSALIYLELTTSEQNSKIEKIINDLLPKIKELPNVKEEVEYLGISEIIKDKVGYMLSVKCERLKQEVVKRQINKLLIEEFAKQKIKIPIEVLYAKGI